MSAGGKNVAATVQYEAENAALSGGAAKKQFYRIYWYQMSSYPNRYTYPKDAPIRGVFFTVYAEM